MTRAALAALIFGIVATAAVASGSVALPEKVKNTLTPIDTVPSFEQLNNVFDNSETIALQSLQEIAADEESDVGIRLRAIHALAKYCDNQALCVTTDLAHQSVTALIDSNRDETAGWQLLVLRAAIETLGTMKVSTDATDLVALLDHPSRDIRASTARALQDICNTQAITPLRVRYSHEPTEQVKLAISEALRILGQCTPNP